MTELTLRGVHDDEEHLVLTDRDGHEYLLEINESLFAAVRRDRAHLSKLHAAGEAVRPRDIQAMIRSGMSAQQVADSTGADLRHIEMYERPVMAERRHVAAQAGRANVYPDNAPDGAPRPLDELCRERLRLRDVDLDTMEWDAWKTRQGDWYVELQFVAGSRTRRAGWEYHRGTVTPVDDEARWLSDAGPTDTGPIPNFGSGSERVFNIESAGTDTVVHEDSSRRDHQAETGRILENLRRRRGRHSSEAEPHDLGGAQDLHQVRPEVSGHGRLRAVDDDPDAGRFHGAHTALSQPADATDDSVFALDDSQPSLLDEPGVSEEAQHTEPILHRPEETGEQPETKDSGKRKNRSSVPSWDEIMFGSKRD